ncbi:MAG: hypothetical protein RIR70_1595 [Pseudomonadota bacterium]|jgi:wyosine [tRNA(Phe)-imidazoG37] synthetase (radical SAM superfamily)
MKSGWLSVSDHRRDSAGLVYVYPVISRRAQGVSVGINLNPNRACNWQCVYCQVPGLTRGGPPAIDLALLETELRGFLGSVRDGDYMERHVPPDMRRLADIALSGDGEPTLAAEFGEVVALIARLRGALDLPADLPTRLITNGSQLGKPSVQQAIAQLNTLSGEVWFKIDAGSEDAMATINDIRIPARTVASRLRQCATRCPTWVQTCLFKQDGADPSDQWVSDYLSLLRLADAPIQGVLLYGLARPSMQPMAARLERLSQSEIERIAERIRGEGPAGLVVKVSP